MTLHESMAYKLFESPKVCERLAVFHQGQDVRAIAADQAVYTIFHGYIF
jgi:hypothetical protein